MKEKASVLICSLLPIIFYIFFGVTIKLISGAMGIETISENSGHISMIVTALCSSALTKKLSGISVRQRLSIKSIRPLSAAAFVLIPFSVLQLIEFGAGNILSSFTSAQPDISDDDTILLKIGTVIIAPICEEIIFRYSMIETARKAFPVPLIILCNGIIFGVLHPYNIQGIAAVISCGIVLSVLYVYSDSLIYGMIFHAFHNFFSSVVSMEKFHFNNEPVFSVTNGFETCSWVWIAVNIIILSLGIWLFLTDKKRRA